MNIYDYPQGSPEWFSARAGVITASMFSTARQKLKSGELSAVAKYYATTLACERIAGESLKENFDTWQMRRGTELEPEARAAHALTRDFDVSETGFIVSDCGRFGVSVDGLCGPDGIAEYKCPIGGETIYKTLIENDVSKYIDQVQGGLWITERKWADLILYVPFLSAEGQQIQVHRVERDEKYITDLVTDLEAFDAVVESFVEKLSKGAK